MTALRPEREGSPYTEQDAYPYGDAAYGDAASGNAASGNAVHGEAAYEDAASFESAVEQLADPLNDPLPGRQTSPWFRDGQRPEGPEEPVQQASAPSAASQQAPAAQYQQPSPAFGQPAPQQPQAGQPSPAQEPEWPGYGNYEAELAEQDALGPFSYAAEQPTYEARQATAPPVYQPPPDDETVGLRTADLQGVAGRDRSGTDSAARTAADTDDAADPDEESPTATGTGTGGSATATAAASAAAAAGSAAPPVVPGGGRAARRRAAKRGGGRHAGAKPEAAGGADGDDDGESGKSTEGAESATPAAPLTRLEARRAARALKPGPGVIASRAIGELFITIGVLMLLFVTYQLWWTNVLAHQQANGTAHHLQDDWANGKEKNKPGVFAPGEGFAIMHIPKLDVVVPIAEGIDKHKVLDRGMVGHYDAESIKTPMPDAKTGNFAVAGHRNTHGEPFRYINRLKPGDPIVVETRDTYYVYEMASILPQTPPSNTSVLKPVPPGSGFTKPGRYITLTTCTPEFTSKYRMIVWGKMVEERPRSEGKPEALGD